jgi:hypothetical protein
MPEDSTTQMSNENIDQTDQTTQSDDNVDYKALYQKEVQNSIGLRKRAQSVESDLTSYQDKAETDKKEKMKANEQFKDLSDSLQKQVDDLSPYKDKWDNFETVKREELLSKLPEEDRERMKDKDLDSLDYITSKISNINANTTINSGGSRSGTKAISGNPFENMSKEAIDSNWGDILSTYKK